MSGEDEVRRATRLLELVIRVLDVTPKELERRLGASPGEVCRMLAGRAEPRLRDILGILHALDLEPAVFFDLLESESRQAERSVPPLEDLLRRLDEPDLVPPGQPKETPPSASPVTEEAAALEPLVERAVRLALEGRKKEPPAG